MAVITFDTSEEPIIMCRFPAEGTKELCTTYSIELQKLLRTRQNILYLLDMRDVSLTTINQENRTAIAESFQKIVPLFDQAVIARAHLINQNLVASAYMSFSWMLNGNLSSPRRIFTDLEQAKQWLLTFKK